MSNNPPSPKGEIHQYPVQNALFILGFNKISPSQITPEKPPPNPSLTPPQTKGLAAY